MFTGPFSILNAPDSAFTFVKRMLEKNIRQTIVTNINLFIFIAPLST
jgi:hypothetical protein